MIAAIAAVGSAAAAVFAAVQIGVAVKAQTTSATFEHLRQIDSRLQQVWSINTAAARREVISAYTDGADGLSADATKYLALLNALDLFALAMESGAVDRPIGDDYLRTLCRGGLVDEEVVNAIRTSHGNNRIYRCLGNKLQTLSGD